MELHGIEWEQLGTHDEHLSDMDYKKVQRVKEVASLDEVILEKQAHVDAIAGAMEVIVKTAKHYDEAPEYQIPEPKPLMSAKSYHDKIAVPLIQKLKSEIRSILASMFQRISLLQTELYEARGHASAIKAMLDKVQPEYKRLKNMEKDYGRLRRFLGDDRANEIISAVKEQEVTIKKRAAKRDYYVR